MARPDLSYLKNLLLFLFGLPLGLMTGLTGTAASVFAVPGVRALLGLLPARAIGTGLAITFFAALASILSYAQHGFLRPWLALLLLAGLSIGKVLGRRFAPSLRLHGFWGTLLAASGLAMMAQGLGMIGHSVGRGLLPSFAYGTLSFYLISLILAAALGAASQVMGLGAELLVPAEIYGLGLAPHSALGTALVVLALASLPGILVLARYQQIEPQSATWLSFGGVLGGLAGALWAVHLADWILIVLFGMLLTVLGIVRVWQRETPQSAGAEPPELRKGM